MSWQLIPNTGGNYFVNEKGQILSKYRKKPRVLVPFKNDKGYSYVAICGRRIAVHRIVASAFVNNDDPLNKVQVNHLNFDRSDNRAENLEWVSHRENLRYSAVRGHMSVKKVVNKSGFKNVYYAKEKGMFRVVVTYLGLKKHIGYFRKLSDAVQARDTYWQHILKEKEVI